MHFAKEAYFTSIVNLNLTADPHLPLSILQGTPGRPGLPGADGVPGPPGTSVMLPVSHPKLLMLS